MLDLASTGRAYLGLAKGAWLDQLGIEEERPLQGLREAVEVIAKLLAGDETGVEGERFRLAPGTTLAYRRERSRMPLMIGSWGRQTIGWAGTVADEIKVGGTANPDLVPLVREWLGAGSRTRIVVGCVSVVDDDGEWARERARAVVGPYLEVVARHDPTLELGPGEDRRSNASRSPAPRRRWPCGCMNSGARAPTASSSEPRRDGRRRPGSS